MNRKKNIMWGLVAITVAVLLILNQVANIAFPSIGQLIITLILIALFISGITSRESFGVFFALAGLYAVYQKPLHFPNISWWILFVSAILLAVGVDMILSGNKKRAYAQKYKQNYTMQKEGLVSEDQDSDNPVIIVKWSAASRYIHAISLTSGYFEVAFGGLEVFFDQAYINPALVNGAEITIDNRFAGIKLFIPKEWEVIDKVKYSFSGITYSKRFGQLAPNAPKLTLLGSSSFGGIEISYI